MNRQMIENWTQDPQSLKLRKKGTGVNSVNYRIFGRKGKDF
ncbi:hypothetical protein [Sphingobacterium hotanense]|nr:hypothetical protein [Sphingobacterium hotanense]